MGVVCVRWGEYIPETDDYASRRVFGASSTRVDGYEGGGWYAGITYTAADGMMPGSGGPSTTTLEESCFAIEPVTTRYIRLYFANGTNDEYLGVAEAAFRCVHEPTSAPTPAPSMVPTNEPTLPPTVVPRAPASFDRRSSRDSRPRRRREGGHSNTRRWREGETNHRTPGSRDRRHQQSLNTGHPSRRRRPRRASAFVLLRPTCPSPPPRCYRRRCPSWNPR